MFPTVGIAICDWATTEAQADVGTATDATVSSTAVAASLPPDWWLSRLISECAYAATAAAAAQSMKRQRWLAQRSQRPAAALIMRLKLRLIVLVVGIYLLISTFIFILPLSPQTLGPVDDVQAQYKKINYDVDGTASSCRCSLPPQQQQSAAVWRWPPRRVQDLICPSDGTYDLTICVGVSGTGVEPTKLELRLNELRHRKPGLQHANDGWSLLRQWYELEDDDKLEQYDMYMVAINATPNKQQAPFIGSVAVVEEAFTSAKPENRPRH
ncbi:unnamed protein product [Schistocephalus solidus]|uniref:Uncharacterized protein n=1 Tax=Schistocephalus solidus TaxID=70667 RepID=A0A3P7DLL5_SCHSO|nr:unnamed protein product [Schistocephalus solidus]